MKIILSLTTSDICSDLKPFNIFDLDQYNFEQRVREFWDDADEIYFTDDNNQSFILKKV